MIYGYAVKENISLTEAALAKRLLQLGCGVDANPYMIGGLLRQLEVNSERPFAEQSPQVRILAEAFLYDKHCARAHGLTDDEIARLRVIRDRVSPSANGLKSPTR